MPSYPVHRIGDHALVTFRDTGPGDALVAIEPEPQFVAARPLMPTPVDQPVRLEADGVRDAPSWRRRGDSDPLLDVEDHDPRNRSVWPGNKLLRGKPFAISRPQERPRLDRQRATHRLAVEYQSTVLRTTHAYLFGMADAGAQAPRQQAPERAARHDEPMPTRVTFPNTGPPD